MVDQKDREIADLMNLIHNFQKVTTVLGTGIGRICTPDGFFKLWNDTEFEAQCMTQYNPLQKES